MVKGVTIYTGFREIYIERVSDIQGENFNLTGNLPLSKDQPQQHSKCCYDSATRTEKVMRPVLRKQYEKKRIDHRCLNKYIISDFSDFRTLLTMECVTFLC